MVRSTGVLSVETTAQKVLSALDSDMRKDIKSVDRLHEDMGRRLHARIRRRIDLLGHYKSRRHNTRKPLNSYLKFSKNKKISASKTLGEYSVYMNRDGKLDPIWVELGTRPHLQRNYWTKEGYILHPGAKPRFFFRNGVRDFVRKDQNIAENKLKEGTLLPALQRDFGKRDLG